MSREPLAIADVIRLGLLCLVAFGVAITPEQVDAVTAFAGALVLLLASLGVTAWLRARLTPVAAPQLPAGTRVVVTTAAGEPARTETLRE